MKGVGYFVAVLLIMFLMIEIGASIFERREPDLIYAAEVKEDIPEAVVEVDEVTPIEEVTEAPETYLSDEEIDLIALITMAEAEGECELGKRLVIDTILNRVDSVYFPDTVNDVIYQTNAFESLYNGRVDRCYVMEDIVWLVREEARKRTNHDVVFFCAGDYSIYGTPLFKVEHHYFSKYEGE